MKAYDTDRRNTIEVFDLPKVLKKLGILNSEPHIDSLIKLAGVDLKGERREKIDIRQFSNKLIQALAKRKKDNTHRFEKVVRKLMAILETKDITIFEFFVMLDVNMSGGASKLEMKTGI
jgi:hypothetical protein